MKAIKLTAISVVIAATLCATAQGAPSDEAQIRALESRFTAAFNAKDVDDIMRVYVPDDSLVVFDVVPPRQYVGAEAYRKDWEGLMIQLMGPVSPAVRTRAFLARTARTCDVIPRARTGLPAIAG